jgi:hypothetical protein
MIVGLLAAGDEPMEMPPGRAVADWSSVRNVRWQRRPPTRHLSLDAAIKV